MTGNAPAIPDITLTLDTDGVIRTAVISDTLAEEGVESWRGRPWGETINQAANGQVLKTIKELSQSGAWSCFQVNQRLPSGRELPFEYTAVSLGKGAGFIAIGKSLQAISDLQSRLELAQQERERDYWKFRDIETRYKMLFDASSDAAIVVRVTNLRIVEANLAATKSLGLLPGPEFYPEMPPRDRKSFDAMLEKVRENGRAPSISLRLTNGDTHWSLRASMMNTDAGSFYLFQMAPLGAPAPSPEPPDAISAEDIIQRLPDGFAIVDRDGVIRRANDTFLDLTQTGSESAVVGQSVKRWLSNPGADASVLLGLVQRHGSVRLMTTTLCGELGSNTAVEISAVGDKTGQFNFVGLLIRDVTTRQSDGLFQTNSSGARSPLPAFPEGISLEQLVQASTEAIEQKAIRSTLELCRGNRTAAAKRLGVSRQSLHLKLKKYDLAGK
jgi:transcriptional regulator PpsR